MGSTNQAAALADAIRAVGEHLIAANPIGVPIFFLLSNCDPITLLLNWDVITFFRTCLFPLCIIALLLLDPVQCNLLLC
jgi:hypothetical protein